MKMRKIAVAVALVLSTGGFAGLGQAATIKEVSTKKRLADVELDEGETFEKGASVCFYDEGGEKGECGIVSKAKGTLVQVKVKKPKRLKVGMTMKRDEDASADEGEGTASGTASDDEERVAKKGAVKRKGVPRKNPLRIVGYYGLPLKTPASFNKLAYASPEISTPTSLWTKDKVIGSASFGVGGEVAIPLGKFAVVPGVRYRTFTPSLIDSDYNKGKLNPYVSTEEKASALGVYVDFQVYRLNVTPIIGINLLAGLDMDMSTVELTATKKDDTPGAGAAEAASATSKLTVISLRLGANTDILALKIIGARLGFGLMIPLVGVGGTFSGKLAESRGLASDAGEDLKKSLDHKKASFGAEIDLGAELAF